MKKLINLLIVTSVFLTSCSSVVFKEITPKKGKELKKFPKELTGVYTDIQNKDSLVISQDYFRYGNKKTIFHLTGKLRDSSTVLKKMKDYFILNVKFEDENNWNIIPFKYENDKIHVYYLLLDTDAEGNEQDKKYKKEKLEKLNLITPVDPVKDTTNLVETYQINPTDKEMKEILKGDFFVKILEFKRLK